MRRPRIKNSKLLAALVLLFQTVNTGITPLIAHAEERDYPEEVTIEYDANNIYNVSGYIIMEKFLIRIQPLPMLIIKGRSNLFSALSQK